jgi:hypothetical protein
MAKMFVRLLIAFLFGLLVGIPGTFGLIYWFPSIADPFIAATPGVAGLKRRLSDVESQRDSMTRQLEKVTSVLGRVEQRYEELSNRFESIEAGLPRAPQGRRPTAPRPVPPRPQNSPPADAQGP